MDKVSIVVPCYNEEENLPIFYSNLKKAIDNIKKTNFEIVFIDDGSKDKTLDIMRDLHKNDSRIRYISFSRNFSKEAAVYAGLKNSTGDFVCVLDANKYTLVDYIEQMLNTLKTEDFDQVALKLPRKKINQKICAFIDHLFYKIMDKISKSEMIEDKSDARMMKQNVVKAVLSMNEYNRYSCGIYGWVGFKTKFIDVENFEQEIKDVDISIFKSIAKGINQIVAFTTAPLVLPIIFGVGTCLLSFINFLIKAIVSASNLGYTIIIFAMGLVMISFGVLALYFAKTYTEVLHRPLYFIRENEEGLVDGKN